jgi:hypothetical protein
MRGPQLAHTEPALTDIDFVMPCGCDARGDNVFFWNLPIKHWWLHNTYACGYLCAEHDVVVVWEDLYTPWPKTEGPRRVLPTPSVDLREAA